jgi:hypothetical protein
LHLNGGVRDGSVLQAVLKSGELEVGEKKLFFQKVETVFPLIAIRNTESPLLRQRKTSQESVNSGYRNRGYGKRASKLEDKIKM